MHYSVLSDLSYFSPKCSSQATLKKKKKKTTVVRLVTYKALHRLAHAYRAVIEPLFLLSNTQLSIWVFYVLSVPILILIPETASQFHQICWICFKQLLKSNFYMFTCDGISVELVDLWLWRRCQETWCLKKQHLLTSLIKENNSCSLPTTSILKSILINSLINPWLDIQIT